MADTTEVKVPRKMDGRLTSISTLATAAGPLCRAGDKAILEATSTDAAVTINFEGRLLTVDGDVVPWLEVMTITGIGVQTPIQVPLTDGWIIGFNVYVASGTVTAGEVEASVHVVRNEGALRRKIMCLASGDLTNAKSLGLGAFT